MKAVKMKTKGTSAHRRLTTSEARMLRDRSAQQKQQGDFEVMESWDLSEERGKEKV